jgi:flagellar protein FliJ
MNGPSFRFRLERVRALRERHEEQAKQDFAVALRHRQQCREEVACADDRIVQAQRAQARAAGRELHAHQTYLERMEHARTLALQELERQEIELEARRVALTKASQDREALERLKEKGLADHLREAARIDQITTDEIAGNGYWRRAA